MSPTKLDSQPTPIELDLSGAFGPETGLSESDFLRHAAEFDAARKIFLTSRSAHPASPISQLEEYKANRRNGLLGRILGMAKNLRDVTDRVVLLASLRSTDVARALFSACCHPFHNDLPRGQRGGRPKIYFAPAGGDNDQFQGLLDALNASPEAESGWALIAVDDGADRELVAGVSEAFLDVWQQHDRTRAPSAVAVCDDHSPLAEIAQRYELNTLVIPRAESPQIHPGVLLAASVMGMDIVKLLRGAAFAANQFVIRPPGDNAAFDLAVLHRMLVGESKSSAWRIEAYISSLRPLATLLTTRSSAADDPKFVIQFVTEAVRFDRLRVKLSAKSKWAVYLNELATQHAKAGAEQLKTSGIAVATIRLKEFDEHAVGQTLATLDLAQQLAARLADEPKP
jgi:hypothetical protein